jgi:hypothetical protein
MQAMAVWVAVVGLLIAHGAAMSDVGHPNGTLVVRGYSGQAPITQINGGSYVAVEALARLMSGSLAYQGSQIVLTVPGAGAALPASGPANPGFSKDFLKGPGNHE